MLLFSVSKHIPVQYDKTARCRSVTNTCPVTTHDQDTSSLSHLKQKRFITKGIDCNCKHVCSLAYRICGGSGGGDYCGDGQSMRVIRRPIFDTLFPGSVPSITAMLFDTVHAAGGTTEQCRYYANQRNNYLLLTLRQIYTIHCTIFQ